VRRRSAAADLCRQPDTAIHALRDIAKHTRGGMQILWRMDGFVSPARPDRVAAQSPRLHGRDRQPEGHRSGRRRPAAVGRPGDRRARAWAVGGTYHVCRIIRMFIEFWDRVSLNEQQTMIGRYRASGRVLGTAA
jgi:deferrochelatase/peroxidase EfeB